MKLNLTKEEIEFLIDFLERASRLYEEVAATFTDQEDRMLANILASLKNAKKGGDNPP